MSRTESKVLQVHPTLEQFTIDKMQIFHWNLTNSQEVSTVSNYLERDSKDNLNQIREKQTYVKLTFTRSLELPYLDRLRQLEQQYDSLARVSRPKKATAGIVILTVILSLFIFANWYVPLLIIAGMWAIRLRVSYPKKLAKHTAYVTSREALLTEAKSIS